MMTLTTLEAFLHGYRWPSAPESAMQQAVERAFQENEIPFRREVELYPGSGRIDFTVGGLVDDAEGTIGIECKVDGSPSDVAEQLIRYAAAETVVGLVLLTSRHTHAGFFSGMHHCNRKPFRLVSTFTGSF